MTASLTAPAPAAGDRTDVWARIAAPLPPEVIAWRQDGKPTTRDGKHVARFVAYVEAGTVRERLDLVAAGAWDLALEMLPPIADSNGEHVQAFKARLQILGAVREDVGQGADYKAAATDAFKRAAVRFGIGHELYQMDPLWVQVDGDGKYAKPLEDPGAVYARKQGRARGATSTNSAGRVDVPPAGKVADALPAAGATPTAEQARAEDEQRSAEAPDCPKCGGHMWDNRLTKRNPKAPDYKCRDKSCDGVVWPPRKGEKPRAATPAPDAPLFEGDEGDDELPF